MTRPVAPIDSGVSAVDLRKWLAGIGWRLCLFPVDIDSLLPRAQVPRGAWLIGGALLLFLSIEVARRLLRWPAPSARINRTGGRPYLVLRPPGCRRVTDILQTAEPHESVLQAGLLTGSGAGLRISRPGDSPLSPEAWQMSRARIVISPQEGAGFFRAIRTNPPTDDDRRLRHHIAR